MLLVYPVREITRFLPALVVVVLAGGATSGRFWQLFAVVIPVLIGLVRYLTTSYRVAAGRVELRRGVISRHLLSTPIERVRTVDLTSSLIQRALGLTTLRVGTGTASTSDDEKLDLDGLPVERAHALRAELLRVSPGDDDAGAVQQLDPAGPPAPYADETVVAFSTGWLKYAPLTGSGVVIAAAALGFGAQFLELSGFWSNVGPEDYESFDAPTPPLGVVILLILLLALPVISGLAVVGYLVTNWDFRVTRRPPGPGGDWHVSRGLFTTRETTLDDDRVAGVVITEPLGLRAATGGQLAAIVTGLDRSQRGGSMLVPPAPMSDVHRTASSVLGVDAPLSDALVSHGPAAARRRWVRALVPALLLAAAAITAIALGGSGWLLLNTLVVPVAAALAADRVRSLGHLLTETHLVSRSGSLVRRRRVIETGHVIGWNFQATWFQRRVGLTTLVATTAGGSQAVPVVDIPEDAAVALAEAALPSLVSQFRA
jgi:putative membrane protein